MATILTAKEVALKLDTTPRTLRKFLRSDFKDKGVDTPGKGGRYAIQASQVNALKRRFNAWSAQRAENAAKGTNEAESDIDPDAA